MILHLLARFIPFLAGRRMKGCHRYKMGEKIKMAAILPQTTILDVRACNNARNQVEHKF